MSVLLLLLACATAHSAYIGQQVIQCKFSNKQSSVLRQLEESMDVWAIHPNLIDIRVETKEQKQTVQSLLQDCRVVIEDLEREVQGYEERQSWTDRQVERLKGRSPDNHLMPQSEHTQSWRFEEAGGKTSQYDPWFAVYQRYSAILQWYKNLANNYPNQVRYVQSIGYSYEGRVIPAVHLTGDISQETPRVGYAYFQCLIHGREWISGTTCAYIANQLLVDYASGDTFVRNLLDNLEIVFVPCVNPDGYEYTQTTARVWRKNRNPSSGTCFGTDLDRNYPEMWGNGGGSTNPCSEIYQGRRAASEIETTNTMNYYQSLAAKKVVLAAIDFQSYGQSINRPWGWTPEDCPDEDVIRGIGDRYVADVQAVHNMTYVNQKAYQLNFDSGTARDFFYGDGSTQWNNGFRSVAWTIMLRSNADGAGFTVSPREIIPTGEENYAAIKNFLNWFLVNGPLPQKP